MRLSAEFKDEARKLLFLLAVLAFFYWSVDQKAAAIKQNINTAVYTQCIAGKPATSAIFDKYDDVVRSLVGHERVSERKDLKDGLGPNAANDAALVARLKGDLIERFQQDCSKPFLP